MSTAISSEACPKCRELTLYRIRRNFWMRLIPTSRHYLCRQCRYQFVSFPPVPYFFGIFLLLLGIGVLVSVLSPDSIGFGHSGFSPLEKTGTVLGIMLILVGFCITASSLIKRLTKFDKESEIHD
jgi:hypothetical protein